MSLGPMFNYDDPEGPTGNVAGVQSAGLAYGAMPGGQPGGMANAGAGVNYSANFNVQGALIIWAVLIIGTMVIVHHDRSV